MKENPIHNVSSKKIDNVPGEKKPSIISGLSLLFTNWAFWIILFYFAAPSLPGWATKNWLPTLFADSLNIPMSEAGPISTITIAVSSFILNKTKLGRHIYAVGGNKQAAEYSGINVKKYRFMAGMFAALFIAVAGIVVCSRNSAAQINGCDSYLMSSLAAVFIGRSVGGAERPNALGTVVGALLISTLENGLTMCGVVYYVLPAVKGAVLCLALVAAYITVKED